ncbi:MAG: hypothetical protein ACXW04_07715 [Methylobacter sp.]
MPDEDFLAISGIEVHDPIELTQNLRFIPFHELPYSFVKQILDPAVIKPEILAKFGLSPAPFHLFAFTSPKSVMNNR